MQEFCLYSVVQQWAHSSLCNYCRTVEDGQKDHQDWMIISFHLPNYDNNKNT